jgi:hypothetical protein
MLTGLIVAAIFGAGGFRLQASRNSEHVWAAASECAQGAVGEVLKRVSAHARMARPARIQSVRIMWPGLLRGNADRRKHSPLAGRGEKCEGRTLGRGAKLSEPATVAPWRVRLWPDPADLGIAASRQLSGAHRSSCQCSRDGSPPSRTKSLVGTR